MPLLAILFLTLVQAMEVWEAGSKVWLWVKKGGQFAGAKVHAELKGIPMAKAIRYVKTDEEVLPIDQPEFGTFYVSAKNEEEEYGDSSFSFFNDQPLPMAQISAQYRIADVVVNLGPKAGILTGTISDAATGKPIPAGFDLAQVKDRTKWMGTSAAPNFRVLIPSSKEMEVKVSHPGMRHGFTPTLQFHLKFYVWTRFRNSSGHTIETGARPAPSHLQILDSRGIRWLVTRGVLR